MSFTADDVGDIPGRRPLTRAERQAFADEWNANELLRAERQLRNLGARKLVEPITITSPTAPEINGRYAIDAEARANVTGIVAALAAGLGFPTGIAKLPYGDADGIPHDFTPEAMKNLASAISSYVFQVNVVLQKKLAGLNVDWPAQEIEIP